MRYNYFNNFNNFFYFPFLPRNCDKPPTVYSLLESIVNYGKEEKAKIRDLASIGRATFFNFVYPLSTKVDKEQFECTILNHFLMRRIGFDTLTAFRIQLNVKLNEIMPKYNIMFDSLIDWNLFTDGEVIIKEGKQNNDNITNRSGKTSTINNNTLENMSTTDNKTTEDLRQSDLPQNQIDLLHEGSYVSKANYNNNISNSTDNSTSKANAITDNNTSEHSNSLDNNTYNETITRTPHDKIAFYQDFQNSVNHIYSMIFAELECLFYQLI